MHYQPELCDLPFWKQTNYPKDDHYNPLSLYISPETDILDFPMQIADNPFTQSRPMNQKKSFYSKNNQSISKCAVTEMSSKEDDEHEVSVIPISQKLFGQETYSRFQKEFQELNTLPTQVITQATFKPNDLRQYLRDSKIQGGCKLRKILKQNVFNQNKKGSKQTKQRVVSMNVGKRQIQSGEYKQKTKYERILEQYFNDKSKKQNIKSRLSREKLPNYKQQYCEHIKSSKPQEFNLYDQQTHKFQGKKTTLTRSKSQFGMSEKSKTGQGANLNQGLIKTFSQHQLKQKIKQSQKIINKDLPDNWMMMNFQQRQSRTIENRKSKEKVGQQLKSEKQVKNCTFKPLINEFKPAKQKSNHFNSYAKLYYQKIRRKF